MKNEQDQMPREVATALLASNQKQSNTFRKVCRRATERVCEPVSRSTALPVSAPKTAIQRMEAKIGKLNAVQLNRWLKRTQRVGNAICDRIDELEMLRDHGPDKVQELTEQIEQLSAIRSRYDALATAIMSELDTRANRGKVKV